MLLKIIKPLIIVPAFITGWLLIGIFLIFILTPFRADVSSQSILGTILLYFLSPASQLGNDFIDIFSPILGTILWIILPIMVFSISIYILRKR